ncbi:MAG: 50S ribosomal protein L29 [Cyanobacteria bacterium REEB67]|jgi:large subunit ribosomal protein L29|nr:50S ribosomal protein L29 [Cyanobacteria bacterium REEB67]
MKVAEIRELTAEELTAQIDETRKNILELRFQHALRKLESPAKMRLARKKLAQLLTIETEKKLGQPKKAAEPKAETKAAEKKPAAKKTAKAAG